MKNFWLSIIIIFSTSVASAQETETRQIGSFSGVRAAEGVDVFLKKGDKEEARVEVTGTAASNVITEISGSYLKVHMRDGGRFRNIEAKVYVTYVAVNKLSVSSAGSIFADGVIKAEEMDISASSAGSIEVSIDARAVRVSSSSAGDVELKGRVRSIIASAESAGEVDAYDLEADDVEADVSSGASLKVNAKESLKARASSGGSVRYRGNPDRSNTNSTSGGSVRKSN